MSTKETKRDRSASTGMFIKVESGDARSIVTTKLGNVTVSARKPSADLVKENVSRSSEALKRLSKRLVSKSGVYLPDKKGFPRYSVDENNPQYIIRRLDGRTSRGEFIDGSFVEQK